MFLDLELKPEGQYLRDCAQFNETLFLWYRGGETTGGRGGVWGGGGGGGGEGGQEMLYMDQPGMFVLIYWYFFLGFNPFNVTNRELHNVKFSFLLINNAPVVIKPLSMCM